MMLPVAIVGHVPITAGITGSPEPWTTVPLLLPLPPLEPPSFFVVDPELDPELVLELLEPPLELEVAPPPLELDPVLDPWDPPELPVPLELLLWPFADGFCNSPCVLLGGGAATPFAQLAAAAADAVTSAKAEADQRAIPIVLTL
jgi:hypothetical protein